MTCTRSVSERGRPPRTLLPSNAAPIWITVNSQSGIVADVVTPDLIREGRARAGLSQAALARRVGRPQSTIARWERGSRLPSLETTRDVIRACGLDLGFALARYDDSYTSLVDAQLALAPLQRIRRLVGDAAVQDVLPVLAAATELDGVLIGPLAEALRGSPLVPAIPLVVRLAVDDATTEASGPLQVVDKVAGTAGAGDLRRDASPMSLDAGLTVGVASLRDLVRIAEASPADSGRTPALRVTLERSQRP